MNSISDFQSSDCIRISIIVSKIFDRICTSRSNSNHLFASRTFQNSYQILNELIVLFYSLDQFDISFKNLRIPSQYLFKQSALKLFFLLENRPSNIPIDDSKSASLSCCKDSFNISVKKSVNSSAELPVSISSYRYMIHSWFLRIFKIYTRLSSKSVWLLSSRRWTQYLSIKNDKNFLAKSYINIRYWFYQLCRRTLDNFTHLTS